MSCHSINRQLAKSAGSQSVANQNNEGKIILTPVSQKNGLFVSRQVKGLVEVLVFVEVLQLLVGVHGEPGQVRDLVGIERTCVVQDLVPDGQRADGGDELQGKQLLVKNICHLCS